MSKLSEVKTDKVTEARKILQEEMAERQKACAEELNQVLEKHGFAMTISQPQIILNPVKE